MAHFVYGLVNAKAGAASAEDAGKALRDEIAALFADRAIAHDVALVAPEEIEARLQAIPSRTTHLLVAGGDGTVLAAAIAAMKHDLPLALVPAGTMNIFARDLGLDEDIRPIASSIVAGSEKPVDVGVMNGRVFLNCVAIGPFAELTEAREAVRDPEARDTWIDYAFQGLRTIVDADRTPLSLSLPGRRLTRESLAVLISNNPYANRRFSFFSRDRIDRGRLGIYCANHEQALTGLVHLAAEFLKVPVQNQALFKSWAPEATISLAENTIELVVDGELETATPPLHFRSMPKALRVVVPLS
ncbi:MAG: diacylglycerol kinase family protein [Pseudomonadota bacterium]